MPIRSFFPPESGVDAGVDEALELVESVEPPVHPLKVKTIEAPRRANRILFILISAPTPTRVGEVNWHIMAQFCVASIRSHPV
jgi:hypothetical protein